MMIVMIPDNDNDTTTTTTTNDNDNDNNTNNVIIIIIIIAIIIVIMYYISYIDYNCFRSSEEREAARAPARVPGRVRLAHRQAPGKFTSQFLFNLLLFRAVFARIRRLRESPQGSAKLPQTSRRKVSNPGTRDSRPRIAMSNPSLRSYNVKSWPAKFPRQARQQDPQAPGAVARLHT